MIEEIISRINQDGWLLHSMSQYRSMGRIVWSCTLRRDGPDRQPISHGQGPDINEALFVAHDSIDDTKLEPETTVHTKVKDPPITLANLLPPRPALVIRRR